MPAARRQLADLQPVLAGGTGRGSTYLFADGVRGDYQRYDHADLYDGLAPAGLFGLDWSNGEGLVAGGFPGYGRADIDFGGARGDFTQSDTTFGGFLGWYGERAWANTQLSYSTLDFDVTRDVRMGPAVRRHAGSTDGSNTAFGINAGHPFGAGAFRHGPIAGLLWQQVEVDGYREGNPASTALAFSDLSLDSLVGSLGWQASYDAGSWAPYLRATWDHDFEDAPEEVFARLQTLPDLEYAVPATAFDGDFGTVVLGARMDLGSLRADVGARASVGQKGGSDTGLFLTLGGSF